MTDETFARVVRVQDISEADPPRWPDQRRFMVIGETTTGRRYYLRPCYSTLMLAELTPDEFSRVVEDGLRAALPSLLSSEAEGAR